LKKRTFFNDDGTKNRRKNLKKEGEGRRLA